MSISTSIKVVLLSGLVALTFQVRAFCFDEAAATYKINPNILKAIAKHESGNQPGLVLRNTNGSMDIGLMGVNTVNLSLGGPLAMLKAEQLLDPCTNVKAGAYLLQRKIAKYGMTWAAVGAYHSETPHLSSRYQWLIYGVLNRNTPESRNVPA